MTVIYDRAKRREYIRSVDSPMIWPGKGYVSYWLSGKLARYGCLYSFAPEHELSN
jgi:hypothetical protein